MFVLNQNIKGGGSITTLNAFNKRTETNDLVGGVISGVSSIASGLLGNAAQSSANKTNLQIARETNATNQQLAQKQNDWNLQQWNRENEYNSPTAQKLVS